MRLRWGLVAAAVAAAALAHLAVAIFVRGAPLLGAGGFAREIAAISGEPDPRDDAGAPPLRVSLGAAERPAGHAPGPEAVLDPEPVRRPPQAGVEWPRLPALEERLSACAAALSAEPNEDRAAPRVVPAGVALPFATGARGASSMDRRASSDALALDVKPATRVIPARFAPGPRPSLALAAGAVRPSLDAAEIRLELSFAPSPPRPPTDWPGPDRALGCPEISVDVTAAGR